MPASADPVIRVLVVDSNQTQSHLLTGALRRQAGMLVTHCPAELSLCVAALDQHSANIILLGDGPPDADRPLELLRRLHATHPEVRFIVLRDRYDREFVVNAMRFGAHALFCRAAQPFKALCRCIHAVHHGQLWINSEQTQYLVDAIVTPQIHVVNANDEAMLTVREEEVVSLVAEGLSNRDIARKLEIKENTVKKALLRIYDKVGMSNRVELVLYALTHPGKYSSSAVALSKTPASTDRFEARSDVPEVVSS